MKKAHNAWSLLLGHWSFDLAESRKHKRSLTVSDVFHAASHPDVPAGFLRHPLRDQSVDEYGAAGRPQARRVSVAGVVRAHRGGPGADFAVGTGGGSARFGVHRECGN